MDLEDLLLILSISHSSDVLGIIHSKRLFLGQDLSSREEQDTLDKLIAAQNSGCECCIVTRDGVFVNSTS